VRRKLGRLRRSLAGVRGLEERVASQGAQLKKLTARQADALSRQRETDKALEARVAHLERVSQVRAVEHERQGFQFGTLEGRLGEIEQRLADGHFVSDTEGEAEARALVDVIRREHEQIRVRMQIVSAYEERLRRVEESVTELYDGDPRHLV
jgi:hypothetical protein